MVADFFFAIKCTGAYSPCQWAAHMHDYLIVITVSVKADLYYRYSVSAMFYTHIISTLLLHACFIFRNASGCIEHSGRIFWELMKRLG